MDILGITIWREARNQGLKGMSAVYQVIRNRATDTRKLWPNDYEEVCLEAYQFSCWNSGDPQRNLYPAKTDAQYNMIPQIFNIEDLIKGANSYYDSSIPAPYWAKPSNFCVQIGSLKFHRL